MILKYKHSLIILCILGLSSCSVINKSNLSGYFTSADKQYNSSGKDYFQFSNDSFLIVRYTDYKNFIGNGTYLFNDEEKISLNFKSYEKPKSYTIQDLGTDFQEDSIFVLVSIKDRYSKLPLEGVSCILTEDNISFVTDSTGQCSFYLPSNENSGDYIIRISYVGYNKEIVRINPKKESNQKVDILLLSGFGFYGKEDDLTYDFKGGNNCFFLSIYDRDIKFKRISASKFNRVLDRYNRRTKGF